MDLTKDVVDKATELGKMLSTKTGQLWGAEEVSIMAQIRLSNDNGEATIANSEICKAKFVDGELVPIKMLDQKQLEARIKERNSKS